MYWLLMRLHVWSIRGKIFSHRVDFLQSFTTEFLWIKTLGTGWNYWVYLLNKYEGIIKRDPSKLPKSCHEILAKWWKLSEISYLYCKWGERWLNARVWRERRQMIRLPLRCALEFAMLLQCCIIGRHYQLPALSSHKAYKWERWYAPNCHCKLPLQRSK